MVMMGEDMPLASPDISEEEITAGKEFAAAIKSGDGKRIVETYRALKVLCEQAEAEGGEGY